MKILFINHSCSRTGAPLVLLYFMEWLKKNHPEVNFDVLSMGGGQLSSEIDSLCTNHFKIYKKKKLLSRIGRFILRKLKLIRLFNSVIYDYEIKKIAKQEYDLIYNNTVVFIEIATLIKKFSQNSKLILHVHELRETIQSYVPQISNLKQKVDLTIAASETVKKDLIDYYQFDLDKTITIHEFSKFHTNIDTRLKLDLRKITIGGIGLVQKRKGVDLFIKACSAIKEINPSIHFSFQWLGSISEENKKRYNKLIEKLGIAKEFEFLGQLNNPNEFLKNLDVFWMTSREDPFPLVCIEAANNGVPILMFNKTTGTQEIINDLDYLIASDLNPKDLAHKTNELINNQELYLKTVKILKERFSMFTVDNQSKKIWSAVQTTLSDK